MDKKHTFVSWKTGLIALMAVICWINAATVAQAADENSDEVITVDLSDYIFQAGGFGAPKQEDGNAFLSERRNYYTSDLATPRDAILAGLSNWSDSIDLSDYNISSSEAFELYWQVLDANPQLFYVENRISYGGGALRPQYSSDYTKADTVIFQNRCDEILSGVEDSWPALEKLLYLHDYIVTHVDYDKTYSKYNAYNALVEGSSVCQGYSLAFEYLANRVGVDCSLVAGSTMEHVWNIICLNGEYFFADLTWDDPSNRGGTYCAHNNFMVDRSRLVSTGHTGTDWTDSVSGVNVYSGRTTSSRYNDFFWKDMNCAVPLAGVNAGYFDSSSTIAAYDFKTGSVSSWSRNTGKWYVWNSDSWWTEDYAGLVAISGEFYYSTPQDIYHLKSDGDSEQIYTLTSSEAAKGYIYGMSAENNLLTYVLKTAPGSGVTGTGTIKFAGDDYKKNLAYYAPVYDAEYYAAHNSDLKSVFGDDQEAFLNHFISHGMAEGRQGSEEFNVYYYQKNYADLQAVFGNDLKSYYLHFINNGKAEGRVANAELNTQQSTVPADVDYSAVFDAEFYANTYSDLKAAFGNNAEQLLNHFVNAGMDEGRQGCESFYVVIYKANNSDLEAAFGDDLRSYFMHYINAGKSEGRVADSSAYAMVYNRDYYLGHNNDLAAAFGSNSTAAFNHFINAGMDEGRVASAGFNVHIYKEKNPDLYNVYGDELRWYFLHYIHGGCTEGRIAN